MMHRARSNIEEVPYCFSRSFVKFQGHPDKKSPILTRIERFRTVNLVWIHRWLWHNAQSLNPYRRGDLLFFKVIHQILKSHLAKIADFDLNWAFADYNFSLNSPMALTWCTSFQVTRGNKLPILTRIERFRTVTQVRIHRGIWDDAQGLV